MQMSMIRVSLTGFDIEIKPRLVYSARSIEKVVGESSASCHRRRNRPETLR